MLRKYLISTINYFHQELKGRCKKDRVGLFIPYYNINLLFQKSLLAKEVLFPLPKDLRNPMKGLINIQNKDNECFRWCLVRYLITVNKSLAKIRNAEEEFQKQLKFTGVKYPVYMQK